MTTSSYRVLVARLYHESNRLNPQPTGEDRFIVKTGDDVLADASGVLAGLITGLRQHGVTVLPALSAGAPPSGLVDHAFYLRLRQDLLQRIAELKPDAIALELHGAMGTTELPDAEGDLLRAVRDAVGPDIPIGVGLDLHAHLTHAMLENSDICLACKENPHSDTVECGLKVAGLLIECLEHRLEPVTAYARVAMILPGANETAEGPLWEIHERARDFAARYPAIRDISIYNVFRLTDDDPMGQVVTVTTDGRNADAPVVAQALVEDFWLKRERFRDNLPTIDAMLATVVREKDKRPFVLGDMGDRVLAGAPGDSVALLSAVLDRYADLRCAISITDANSAQAAHRAGVGATITLDVGGKITPGFRPRTITGVVTHVSNGDFTLAGPFHGGEPSELGTAAVVLVDGRVHVLLTSLPAYGHDPAVYTSQGIVIADQDFVVAKSGYHFRLNYAGIATPALVETPGVGYYGKGLFAFEKSRFWPEHDVAGIPAKPVVVEPRYA